MEYRLGTLIKVGQGWTNLITVVDPHGVEMVDVALAITLRLSPRHARDCIILSRIFEEAFHEV